MSSPWVAAAGTVRIEWPRTGVNRCELRPNLANRARLFACVGGVRRVRRWLPVSVPYPQVAAKPARAATRAVAVAAGLPAEPGTCLLPLHW